MLHRRHLSGVGVDGIVGECSASANRRGLDAGGPQGGIRFFGRPQGLGRDTPNRFRVDFPRANLVVDGRKTEIGHAKEHRAAGALPGRSPRQFVGLIAGRARATVRCGGAHPPAAGRPGGRGPNWRPPRGSPHGRPNRGGYIGPEHGAAARRGCWHHGARWISWTSSGCRRTVGWCSLFGGRTTSPRPTARDQRRDAETRERRGRVPRICPLMSHATVAWCRPRRAHRFVDRRQA